MKKQNENQFKRNFNKFFFVNIAKTIIILKLNADYYIKIYNRMNKNFSKIIKKF